MFEDSERSNGEAPQETVTRRRVTREYVLRRDYVESSAETQQRDHMAMACAATEKIKTIEDLVQNLEFNLKTAQVESKRLNTVIDLKEQDFKLALEIQAKEKAEAEERAIYHFKRSERAKEDLIKIKEAHADEARTLQKRIDGKDEELSSLRKRLHNMEAQKEQADVQRQRLEENTAHNLHQFKQRIVELEHQLLQQHEKIVEGLGREQQLVSDLSSANTRVKEQADADFDTTKMRALDEQIQRHNLRALSLDKENRKLSSELQHYKDIYQDVEVLRNEKQALEKKVQDWDILRKQVLRLDVENARLKKERLDWAGYLEANDGAEYETPHGLIFHLTQERESARLASEQLECVKKELVEKNSLLSTLSDHVEELTGTLQEREKTIKSDHFAITLLEKDVAMMKRHVDLLEDQLKLYDIEERSFMTNYDAQKTERIAQLEALLKEVEERATAQTQDTLRQSAASNETSSPSDSGFKPVSLPSGESLSQCLRKLFDEKLATIQELMTLRAEQAICKKESHLAKEQIQVTSAVIERYNLNSIDIPTARDNEPVRSEGRQRILTLKDSPALEAEAAHKHQMKSLREENESLLKIVQDLQSSGSSDTPLGKKRKADDYPDNGDGSMLMIPRISIHNKEEQLQEVKTQLASREKRIRRLHQVWESKLQYYNDVIRNLFGYRVDFLSDGNSLDFRAEVNIRLSSIFVPSRELFFQFKANKDSKGALDTLSDFQVFGSRKSEYWELVKNTYDTYVTQRGNIPAFLSATTLELHESTTDYRKDPMEMAQEGFVEEVEQIEYAEEEHEGDEGDRQDVYDEVEQEYDDAEHEEYGEVEQVEYDETGREVEQGGYDHDMQEGYDEEVLDHHDQHDQEEEEEGDERDTWVDEISDENLINSNTGLEDVDTDNSDEVDEIEDGGAEDHEDYEDYDDHEDHFEGEEKESDEDDDSAKSPSVYIID